nr:PREDICTED: uncharacterized protein LOC104965484 [Notothenia coriiceps]
MEDVLRELVRISTEQQTLQRQMIQQQKQNALLHLEVQKCLTAAPPIEREATVQPNPGRFIDSPTCQRANRVATSVGRQATLPGTAQGRMSQCRPPTHLESSLAQMIPVKVNGKDAEALVDSEIKVSCELKVGVVPSLPVPVLVGRDCPLYKCLRHQKEEQRGNQSSSADEANDNPFAAFPGDLSTGDEEGEVALLPSLKGQFETAQMEDPNLLHARSNVTEIEGKPVPGVDHEVAEVEYSPGLSKAQLQQTKELVQQSLDVFSLRPGRTTMVEHQIHTEPGQKVKMRPYRVPEERQAAIEQEVQKMLAMGVIEESHSEWTSPVVLVPKPDNTNMFCNDF